MLCCYKLRCTVFKAVCFGSRHGARCDGRPERSTPTVRRTARTSTTVAPSCSRAILHTFPFVAYVDACEVILGLGRLTSPRAHQLQSHRVHAWSMTSQPPKTNNRAENDSPVVAPRPNLDVSKRNCIRGGTSTTTCTPLPASWGHSQRGLSCFFRFRTHLTFPYRLQDVALHKGVQPPAGIMPKAACIA